MRLGPARVPPPSRAYRIAQPLAWAGYCAAGLVLTKLFNPLSLRLALTAVFACSLAYVLSDLLRALSHARRWWERPVGPLLLRLAGGAMTVAVIIELCVWAFGLFVVRVYTIRSSTPGVMFATFLNWLFAMLLWTAVYASVQFFQRYRLAEIRRLQLEVAARDAQLGALQSQIHPHFLFNALNSLRALIPEDPTRARDLVTGLAELMRYALQAGRRECVPLAEEIAVVEGYLRLEGARFEDRLRWTLAVPPELHAQTLPPMVLQSLVENAVKHGIATSSEGGAIEVTAAVVNGASYALCVTNPGRVGPARADGIGLANVRERLRLRYGDAARLDLEQCATDLVAATVTLPLEGAR